MANLSHVVNSLTFGPPIERKMERRLKLIPEEYFKVENTRPMDGRHYLDPKLHQAFHHYIKVRCFGLISFHCCVMKVSFFGYQISFQDMYYVLSLYRRN